MKHILLVDDETHVLRVMQQALERAGYTTSTAQNGEQALVQLRLQLPDVMIADVQMPRMSGDLLCQQILLEYPEREFLIIITTARIEAQFRDWSRQIDQLVFIEKPISMRAIISMLEDHFQRLPTS